MIFWGHFGDFNGFGVLFSQLSEFLGGSLPILMTLEGVFLQINGILGGHFNSLGVDIFTI